MLESLHPSLHFAISTDQTAADISVACPAVVTANFGTLPFQLPLLDFLEGCVFAG